MRWDARLRKLEARAGEGQRLVVIGEPSESREETLVRCGHNPMDTTIVIICTGIDRRQEQTSKLS